MRVWGVGVGWGGVTIEGEEVRVENSRKER